MDFLTAFPYVGIILLMLFNVWIVSRRAIVVEEREEELNH